MLVNPINPATRIYNSIAYWHYRMLRRRLGLPVCPPHCHHQYPHFYNEPPLFFPPLRFRKPLTHDVFERRIY